MYLPPSFLDEIRSRLRVSEVIGKRVSLKLKGREFQGLCPFHKEKTPSFTVNDEKGFYHCFGCGAHGDVLKFTMETGNLPFMDAVKELADIANLEVPKPEKNQVEKYNQVKSYYEIMDIACGYFQENLQKNRIAADYLRNREISDSAIDKFKIGFAENSMNALKDHMNKLGISEQQMLDVGLLSKNDRGQTYDKFRNRIIFPIIDIKGNIVAYGGRILGDGKPKYLNSPETIIFKKGDILYNENNVRKLAFKTGKLVIVEGYMDAIALDIAGIKIAVAPLGTAITENQIKRIWNMTDEPVICLDGDQAGVRAMQKASETCLPLLKAGKTLKFTIIENGLDPDDYVKKYGVQKMRNALKEAKNLSEIIWQTELNRKKVDTPERKAELEKRLKEIVAKISDIDVAKHYRNYFNQNIWQYLGRANYKRIDNKNLTAINQVQDDYETLEGYKKVLLKLAWCYPTLLEDEYLRENFENIEFESKKLDKISQAIIKTIELNKGLNNYDLNKLLEKDSNNNYIKELYNICEHLQPSLIDFEGALKNWNMYDKKIYLLNLQEDLTKIKQRENFDITSESVIEMMRQISKVQEEIVNLQNEE